MLDAVTGLASLNIQQNPDRVADWLTLVVNHPAAAHETKDRARQLLSVVEKDPSFKQYLSTHTLEELVEIMLE
jgi:hypothetical protein